MGWVLLEIFVNNLRTKYFLILNVELFFLLLTLPQIREGEIHVCVFHSSSVLDVFLIMIDVFFILTAFLC